LIEDVIKQLADRSKEAVTGHSVIVTPAFWCATDHAFVELRHGRGSSKYFIKMARTGAVSDRIQQEVIILNRLQEMHVKNIPEIVLSGSCDGRAFLAERFIEGTRLKDSAFSKSEKLRMILEWLKGFYSQTLGGMISPDEMIQKAGKVTEFTNGLTDLTEALSVLERCRPSVEKIPTVCWHGDAYDMNFVTSPGGIIAVDFGYAKFGEPPAEPYVLVPPSAVSNEAKDLDLLSVLDGISPFFLGIYQCIIRLGDELKIQRALEENLLLVDMPREFPSRELGKLEGLLMRYKELA
jgi:hypothetical protein